MMFCRECGRRCFAKMSAGMRKDFYAVSSCCGAGVRLTDLRRDVERVLCQCGGGLFQILSDGWSVCTACGRMKFVRDMEAGDEKNDEVVVDETAPKG